MSRYRVSAEELEALVALQHCTGRPCSLTSKLEHKGLVVTGESRFGPWVKLSAEGRQRLERSSPAAPPGSVQVSQAPESDTLLRGAVPRQRRTTANHARGTKASISPPEAVQPVGGTSSHRVASERITKERAGVGVKADDGKSNRSPTTPAKPRRKRNGT